MRKLSLGLGLSRPRHTYANYVLALDFRGQSYWENGAAKPLASIAGYSFTDSVDNQPNITTSGYTALVSETSRLTITSPITADEDFIAWAVVNFADTANAQTPFEFSNATVGERINFGLTSGGGLQILVVDNSVNQYAATLGSSVVSGRCVLMVRRSGGQWVGGTRKPDGTVTLGTNTTGTFPTLTQLRIGHIFNGAAQPDSAIEGMYVRRGTFSDAQITAILQGA